jgi:hypothetical protein
MEKWQVKGKKSVKCWGLGVRCWGFGVLGVGGWGLGVGVLEFWGVRVLVEFSHSPITLSSIPYLQITDN